MVNQNGQGGSFNDINDPNTTFTGIQCETYTLQWTINTPCDFSSDDVIIEFFNTPTTSNAGNNQWYLPGTITTLEGNTPQNGTGQWFIAEGTGGNVLSPNNPNSIFTGIYETFYIL